MDFAALNPCYALPVGVNLQRPKKHHYLPVFYLKQWARADGTLTEYARRHNAVRPRSTYPRGTGYEIDLYTIPGNAERTQEFETGFMGFTDDLAAQALKKMLSGDKSPWDVRMRSGWSRFIMSLLLRGPSEIERFKSEMKAAWEAGLADIKTRYDSFRRPTDPLTYEEFLAKMNPSSVVKSGLIAAQKVMDNPNIGRFINEMTWEVVTLERNQHLLLTSDRPVILTNGLNHPNGHLALPISPDRLFVAYKHDDFRIWIRSVRPAELIANSNANVVGQARKFVYARDETQTRFVQNHFGSMPERDYFAGVGRERPPLQVIRNTDFEK